MPSWTHITAAVEAVCAGDAEAWPALMAALEPKLQVLVRYQRIGRLRSREDDLRNIVVAVFEKLRADDHRVLRRYLAMPSRPSLEGWMRRVVRSTAIDYLRGHPEYRRSDRGDGSSDRWVSLHTYTSVHARAGDSGADKRREVLDVLADTVAAVDDVDDDAVEAIARRWDIEPLHLRRVAARGKRMLAVVELLFQGHRHGDIADQLGLSRREVEVAIAHVEALLTARWKSRSPA